MMHTANKKPGAWEAAGPNQEDLSTHSNKMRRKSQGHVIFERILAELEGRRETNGSITVLCPCPNHEDKNPSLNIKLADSGGKLLVHCYAGCSQEAVVAALQKRGLWPEKSSRKHRYLPMGIPDKWYGAEYSAHWSYYDKDGKISGHVVRYEGTDGKQVIPFFKKNGSEWKAKAAKVPRPLYNLHLLSRNPKKPVLIVEGEKAAEAAGRLLPDYVCTTWPSGSKAVNKADFKPMARRDVIIWPDADDPGRKAAGAVKTKCQEAGMSSVAVVKTPQDVKAGWDLADAEAERWTGDQVLEWIKQHQGGQFADVDADELPDPLPLTRENVAADPYPVDALGPIIAPAVKKIVEVVQPPDAICAQSVLAAATLCVQPFANIKIDGRCIPILQNFISICSTGGRKSEADKTATAMIRAWEEEQIRKYQRDYKEYMDAYEAYQTQKKNITGNKKLSMADQNQKLAELRQSEPERPFNPVRLTSDPTFEGLVKLFERSLPSLGLFADEGGLFSGGFSMSQEKQLYSAAGYSKFWDGARIDRIRAGSESFSLYDRRLTVHLMMQDQVAGDFFNNSVLQDQGLLSRFLVAFPSPTVGKRIYKEVNLQESSEMKNFHSRVGELLCRDMPLKVDKKTGQELNELAPTDLELTADAKQLWIQFYHAVEENSGENGTFENISGFANKAPEHCLRLAGVLTLFENPNAKVIDLKHVEAASELLEFYLNERIRIRRMANPDEQLLRAQELKRWLSEKGLKRVCLPDVYQYGPYKLRTAKQAKEAIQALVNHYHLLHREGKHESEISGKITKESWIVR